MPSTAAAASAPIPAQNQSGAPEEPPEPDDGPEGLEPAATEMLSSANADPPPESFAHSFTVYVPLAPYRWFGDGTPLVAPSPNDQA